MRGQRAFPLPRHPNLHPIKPTSNPDGSVFPSATIKLVADMGQNHWRADNLILASTYLNHSDYAVHPRGVATAIHHHYLRLIIA